MRTRYRIDTYQKTYFVIDSFEQLMEATRPDFAPIYALLRRRRRSRPARCSPAIPCSIAARVRAGRATATCRRAADFPLTPALSPEGKGKKRLALR